MDYTELLNRESLNNSIKNTIQEIMTNINNPQQKKCIFIYGNVGIGKTSLVDRILDPNVFDIIRIGNGPSQTPLSGICKLTSKLIGTKSVYSMMTKKAKQIVIVMDGIGLGTNSSTTDGGALSFLLKLVRPKRTKRQLESDENTNAPVICISGTRHNKKISELMKVSYVFNVADPLPEQYLNIISSELDSKIDVDTSHITNLYDVNRIMQMGGVDYMYKKDLGRKFGCGDDIVNNAMRYPVEMNAYFGITADIDKTVVGMNFHENIIDGLLYSEETIDLYSEMVDFMIASDFIDRNIFQRQLWQLTEISSLLKLVGPNAVHCKHLMSNTSNVNPLSLKREPKHPVRFTKILTKYSSEYSNQQFIQRICNEMHMDTHTLMQYFYNLFRLYDKSKIIELLQVDRCDMCLTKLDIARMERYLTSCMGEIPRKLVDS